jgi:hypothetical protein
MADEIVAITPAQWERVRRVVQNVEPVLGNLKQLLATRATTPPYIVRRFIKITSTSQTASRYPGRYYLWDDATSAWVAGDETIWVKDANGASLATATFYAAELVEINGPAGDERPVFETNHEGEVFGSGGHRYLAQWHTGSGASALGDATTTLRSSIIYQDASATEAFVNGALNVLGANHFYVGTSSGQLDVSAGGGVSVLTGYSTDASSHGYLQLSLNAPNAANSQTATLTIAAANQSNTLLNPNVVVQDSTGTTYTGAWTTVSGLVFKAGFYISGTISITSSSVSDFTEAAQDAVGAMVDTTLTYTDGTPLLSVTGMKESGGQVLTAATIADGEVLFRTGTTIDGKPVGSSGGLEAWDATLDAFAALTIAANSLTIGTGADAFSQTTFAANTFPARGSIGNLVAKTITDSALTAIAIAVGSAGGVVTNGGALGTPSSGTLTNCTGLPPSGISSTTGTGAVVRAANPTLTVDSAITATPGNRLTLDATSSGTPAAGFGSEIYFTAEDTTSTGQLQAAIIATWGDATHASAWGALTFYVAKAGSAGSILQLDAGGTAGAQRIGVFGATPSPRLASPDMGTALTAFGWTSGTPTFGAANLTGTIALARLPSGTREVQTADRTYYVRTDGSDSNDGSANTSGAAFLTIQKAIDTIAGLDCKTFNMTVSIADGTYTGAITLKSYLGSGTLTITGNTTTPGNVLISTTSANAITATAAHGTFTLTGMKLQTTTSGHALSATGAPTKITLTKVHFGACPSPYSHMDVEEFANITYTADYTITGGRNHASQRANVLGGGDGHTLHRHAQRGR